MQDNSQFTTSDLGQASYLSAIGYRCVAVRPVPGDRYRCEFVFPPEAARVAEDYFLGATVEAQRFMLILRELKARLRCVRQ